MVGDSKERSRVLVIGGSGYVGRAVVSKLCAKLGPESVVVASRRVQPRSGIEVRAFDAADAASLRQAMDGITHVVNCVMGDAATMIAVTKNVLEIALACRIKRVVHFSSVAVYGSLTGNVDETSKAGSGVDWYGAVKLECDQLVAATQQQGLDAVVLRPGLIYGPGSEQWTVRIGRLLMARRLGDLLGRGEGLCNLVHVSDVAAATYGALFRSLGEQRIFNLAAPHPVTWNRYLTDFARAIDVSVTVLPAWRVDLESKVLAYPLKVIELLLRKLRPGYSAPPLITPSLAWLFNHRALYVSSAADVALLHSGWTSYEAGIKESAEWFKSGNRGQR